MTDTLRLIEKAVKKAGSAYRLAKLLRISEQAITKWRQGKNRPGPTSCYKIADLLGLDRTDVLCIVMAEKHAADPHGDFWNRLTPRILPAAVVAFALAGLGHTGRVTAAESAAVVNDVYIMRTGRRRRRQEGFAWDDRGRFAAGVRRRYAPQRPPPKFDSTFRRSADWRR